MVLPVVGVLREVATFSFVALALPFRFRVTAFGASSSRLVAFFPGIVAGVFVLVGRKTNTGQMFPRRKF